MIPREFSVRIVVAIFFLLAILSTLAMSFILFFLLHNSIPFLSENGLLGVLTNLNWNPTGEPPAYGILPLIVGSILVTLGAMVISVPLSLGTTIYLSEYASHRVRSLMKPAIELLAGIPSVVYGFFGLVVLSEWIRVGFDKPSGTTWFAGSIILAIMALPTIISVAEDSLRNVDREYRAGSLALGATKWQTISQVVMPSALSGITAAVILGTGRAIGETMAVMMVTGNAALIPEPITNVFSPVRTITGTLGIEMGEVPIGSMHYHGLFMLAFVLLVITLGLNLGAILSFRRIKSSANNGKRRVLTKYVIPFLALVLLAVNLKLFILFICLGLMTIASKRIRPQTMEKIAYVVVVSSTLLVIGTLGVIMYQIVSNGLPGITWEFLTQAPSDLGRSGGVFPAIVGTVYLVIGAILISLPIGVGAAIYLIEYTKETWLTKVIRHGTELLNSTPSIVFGLFGFAFLVIYLNLGISLIAGQVTLALMVLPTIIRTTEESIKSVPGELRHGSLALGATKLQTIRRVVLPQAIPGILTGTIISIGRAAGETAPIMFTAVVFSQRFLPTSLTDPVMSLTYHLFILSTNIPGARQNQYATALVLMILVLGVYMVAALIRHKHENSK